MLRPNINIITLRLLPSSITGRLIMFIEFINFRFFREALTTNFLLKPRRIFVRTKDYHNCEDVDFIFGIRTTN